MTMKRSSYLRYDEIIGLGKRGLTVCGYDKTEKFVCRVEINAAGLAGRMAGPAPASRTAWYFRADDGESQLASRYAMSR
jgi:hypothetical protein